MKPLGRRRPSDRKHIGLYRYVPRSVASVERNLRLPSWHWEHDQGSEGSCVGYGESMMTSILNGRRYCPRELYRAAQLVDEYSDTPPAEGTSVRAACDILRTRGHRRLYNGRCLDWRQSEGISENRWAVSTDEMRTAISKGIPVTIGIDWYERFDDPTKIGTDWWAARSVSELGRIRGGHALCVYGASDRRQAFKLKNSWGRDYPLVYLPYEVMQRLLDAQGEATLVSDRTVA